MKYCVKLDKSSNETLGILRKAYGEAAVKKYTVFEWYKRFKKGREDMKDEKKSKSPKTYQARQLMRFNRWLCSRITVKKP